MPSSNKTNNLGLNIWMPNDKPARGDFVLDNYIIDNKLGEHLLNQGIHLNEEEKLKVTQPYTVSILQGTDEETRTITLDFIPNMAVYFAANTPAVTEDGGTTVVNSGIAVKDYGTSGGIILSGTSVKVKQQIVDAVNYNLNSTDLQYILIAFR